MKFNPAEDMRKAGVKKLSRYGKPYKQLTATIRPFNNHGKCQTNSCHKLASYQTPEGKRCFYHAVEIVHKHRDSQP